MEVLDLARAGAVHVEVDEDTLDEAPEAYRRLHEGRSAAAPASSPGTDRADRIRSTLPTPWSWMNCAVPWVAPRHWTSSTTIRCRTNRSRRNGCRRTSATG